MADAEKLEGVVGDGGREEEEERFLEGMAVLDFDMLCSTVALQTEGRWRKLENFDDRGEGGELGGVLRMWEGELLDCFDDRRIALESLCCPCYRFGKNMRRAGFGSCLVQAAAYFTLSVSPLLCCIAFFITKQKCFIYLAAAFTVLIAVYLGFFRTRIRRKFNIRGTDSFLDDCIFHIMCPCCSLCQESRTLEINNVQDGTWHGRGDTVCIGNSGERKGGFIELRPPPLVAVEVPICSAIKGSGDGGEPSPV